MRFLHLMKVLAKDLSVEIWPNESWHLYAGGVVAVEGDGLDMLYLTLEGMVNGAAKKSADADRQVQASHQDVSAMQT